MQASNRPNRRFRPTKRVCQFCVEKTPIDYKQVDVLSRYVNEFGRMRPRRQTGTCAKHQRHLAREIKRARHIALLPFVSD
ncbi:MAG: 30S ribosomal protein S18 [Candidatus Promineofilum sp.]|jgi:small subunit ribosomal protein S18|nr:30S ribosomal protein S18 [Promineifilum sp.]MBP8949693.1 30S ribosomal protein S18 [Promineifilum sp.]